MKKLNKALLLASLIAGSASVFAAETITRSYDPTELPGFLNCRVEPTDKTAVAVAASFFEKVTGTVTISTSHLLLDGAAAGNEFGGERGKFQNVPVSFLANHSFRVSKDDSVLGGEVTITPNDFSKNASLVCDKDAGGKPQYGSAANAG